MTTSHIQAILATLLGSPEHEVVEFKRAKNQFDANTVGEYFSALSNEANLRGIPCAWLIMGVNPTTHQPDMPEGTLAYAQPEHRTSIKKFVADHTGYGISFVDILEHIVPEGARLLMFQIPAAPRGMPVAWKGHYYARQGESLAPLNLEKLERIRAQAAASDWSAGICPDATLDDLDPAAIARARVEYGKKHPELSDELTRWDAQTFLNKVRVLAGGRITRTALILLGNPESIHHLTPLRPQITWILKGADGVQRDYAHFGLPFLLVPDALLARVRNLTVRDLPDGTLFPREVSQYDPWVIREALHNAIAHQNFLLGARVSVVETDNDLLISSPGEFFYPGGPDAALMADAPPDRYRNTHLAEAMVELNLIDTIGSGIQRIYRKQRERSFPMPDFETSDQQVQVRIHGRVLDAAFTHLLLSRTDLPLPEIVLLDRIQKKGALDNPEDESRLRAADLIEGRRPHLRIAAKIAKAVGQEVDYINRKGLDKTHYKALVLELIRKFGSVPRKKIDGLLLDKLPGSLDAKQKANFIRNLLQEMAVANQIEPNRPGPGAEWKLSDKPSA